MAINTGTNVQRPSTGKAEKSAENANASSANAAEEGSELEMIGNQLAVIQMGTKINLAQLARSNANLDKANQIV